MASGHNVPDTDPTKEARSVLDQIVRQGAQAMLKAALDAEVGEFLEAYSEQRDDEGNRYVVGNGYLPERTVLTGAGPLEVRQPRVRDRRGTDSPEAVTFHSGILPRYLRRSQSVDELLPWLYLRGVSTGAFGDALEALVGPEAKNLSPNVVSRLTTKWSDEYKDWCRSDLSEKNYVYLWADGIYFNIRLEEDRQCLLVVMGATPDGKKELVGLQDGYRESEQSWKELLLDLKARGLKEVPKLAVGDGALGFWAALRKVFPKTREQRCWVHKTANVLNCFPKKRQGKAKSDLHQIWMAATREDAYRAFDSFLEKYREKYPKAAQCLSKDREQLLAFYDFPAEHWAHLRTTNPIESTFATVRLRHRRTKGSGTRVACLAMVFKLVQAASKQWRRLTGYQKIVLLLEGNKFVDGVLQERNAA